MKIISTSHVNKKGRSRSQDRNHVERNQLREYQIIKRITGLLSAHLAALVITIQTNKLPYNPAILLFLIEHIKRDRGSVGDVLFSGLARGTVRFRAFRVTWHLLEGGATQEAPCWREVNRNQGGSKMVVGGNSSRLFQYSHKVVGGDCEAARLRWSNIRRFAWFEKRCQFPLS